MKSSKKVTCFLISLLLLFFYSCSGAELQDNKTITDIFKTEKWYYTKHNDTIFYFKINLVSDTLIRGEFFALNGDVYARKEKIELICDKGRYFLKIRGIEKEIKAEYSTKDNYIIITYSVQKRKILGLFRIWNEPVTFVVKKYQEPEFITFNKRYKEKIFENVQILNDIEYGKAKGYWTSYPTKDESYLDILLNGIVSTIKQKELSLKMDIYFPEGDSVSNRPLIMFLHGGAFYIGDKQSNAMVEFCKYFTSLGYVAVSVNYRLGFIPAGVAIERAGYRALQDAHAAMRFLVQNHEKYGIDTSNLFVAGTSAGAITALNLAFMRNNNRPRSSYGSVLYDNLGKIESSGNNIKNKFNIKSVVNMWGAVDNTDILNNSNASVISFHGDADLVVPINCDFPFKDIKANFSSVILNRVCGSLEIHIKLRELNRKEELHILENCGHSPHVDKNDKTNDKFKFILEKTTDFLYSELKPQCARIQSYPKLPINRAMNIYTFGCDTQNYKSITWKIYGGLIISQKDNSVRVVWFDDADEHKLLASVLFENGLSFIDEYKF